MAISVYKTWNNNDRLTADDLNNSFLRLVNNGTALVSPFTTSPDLNGNALIVDLDGDSKLAEVSDDILSFRLSATDLFKWDMSTASAVNGLTATASATGAAVKLDTHGSDTNVDLSVAAKGTGLVILRKSSTDLFKFDVGTASGVNGLTWTASATGNAVKIDAQGSDSNIDMSLAAKGTGKLVLRKGSTDLFKFDVGTASGVNGIDFTAKGTGVAPTIVAAGSDSNIGMTISPKGNGTVTLAGGSGTIAVTGTLSLPTNSVTPTFLARQAGCDVYDTTRNSAGVSIASTSYADCCNADVTSNGADHVAILAMCQYTHTSGTTTFSVRRGTTVVGAWEPTYTATQFVAFWVYDSSPAAGTNTYHLSVKNSTPAGTHSYAMVLPIVGKGV